MSDIIQSYKINFEFSKNLDKLSKIQKQQEKYQEDALKQQALSDKLYANSAKARERQLKTEIKLEEQLAAAKAKSAKSSASQRSLSSIQNSYSKPTPQKQYKTTPTQGSSPKTVPDKKVVKQVAEKAASVTTKQTIQQVVKEAKTAPIKDAKQVVHRTIKTKQEGVSPAPTGASKWAGGKYSWTEAAARNKLLGISLAIERRRAAERTETPIPSIRSVIREDSLPVVEKSITDIRKARMEKQRTRLYTQRGRALRYEMLNREEGKVPILGSFNSVLRKIAEKKEPDLRFVRNKSGMELRDYLEHSQRAVDNYVKEKPSFINKLYREYPEHAKNYLKEYPRTPIKSRKEPVAIRRKRAKDSQKNFTDAINNLTKSSEAVAASETAFARKMRAEEADKELISLRKRRARESQQNFSNAINKLTQSGSGNKAANTLFAERLQAEETAKKALDKINADNEKARVKDEIARGKKSRARSLREAKAQYRERERIATIANDYHTSTAALRPNKTAQEQRTHAQITKGLQEATTARQAHNVVRIRTNELALLKKSTRELAKQNMLMQRVKASFTEMVTGYATAFAAMGLAYSVNSIGQALESAENTMLSVSESKEDFDENQAFIREESYRLGVPLRTASANYSKMYAAKGSLSKEDTQQLFLGLAEQSTILGLSDEGVDRSMKAVQQMMSKGKITSEELKEQLGDVMPTGVPLMALAAKDAGITKNGTRQELYKMMEDGKVFSEEILPFFATRLRDAARANGALEKALNSNATAMKRMMNSAELAADVVFKGGWAEGSTELFQEIAEFFHDNEMALKSFGKIFGSLFKGLTIIVRSFNHLLQSLGTILDGFTTILGDASAALLLLLSPTVLAGVFSLEKAFVGVRTVLLSIGKILLRTVAPIIAIIAAIEEVVNLFTATKIGSVFHRGNPNVKKMSDEDKAKLSTPERWMVNFKEGFEDSIFSEINTALVSAKDFAKGFLENNSIEDIITNLFESLGVKITEYISKVDFASVFDGFFSNLWTIITTVYSTFGTTLKNLITLIAPLAFNILNELTRYLDGKLKEFLAKWDTQLIDSLTKFGDGISKFIDELWDKIKETIFGWVDGRREEAIKTGMQNAQNKVGALGDISSSNYQGYTKYTQPLQPTEQNINVSVELDGEKVGGVVVNTNAYNGATERKIKEVNGG